MKFQSIFVTLQLRRLVKSWQRHIQYNKMCQSLAGFIQELNTISVSSCILKMCIQDNILLPDMMTLEFSPYNRFSTMHEWLTYFIYEYYGWFYLGSLETENNQTGISNSANNRSRLFPRTCLTYSIIRTNQYRMLPIYFNCWFIHLVCHGVSYLEHVYCICDELLCV